MNQRLLKLGGITAFCSLLTFSSFAQSPPNDACGTVLKFDGGSDMITFPNSPLGASGTFETWLAKDNWGDHVDDVLFGNNIGHVSANSFYVSLHDAVGFHMRYGGGGESGNIYVNSNDTKLLTAGSWHHLAATWDNNGSSTTIAIYLDGVQLATQTTSLTINMGSAFQLGKNPNSGTLKNAKMDEVRVWNYARSASELQTDMNSQLTGTESGLMAYYDFDEAGSSVITDLTANDNTGTLVDLDPSTAYMKPDGSSPCLLPPNSDCGTVLNFDGINGTVSIPHSSSLKPSAAITIEAWINPTDISTNKYYEIYRKEDGSARHLLSFQEFGTILSFGLHVNGTYAELDIAIDKNDFLNQWNHVAATYDGTTKRVFVNGVEIGNQGVSGSISTAGTSNAYIGSASGLSEFFSGKIDEVRIWSKAKSSVDIINEMNVELIGDETDLISYYNFNDGTNSTTVSDLTGNNHGSLVNLDETIAWTLSDGSDGGHITMPTTNIDLAIGDSTEINGVFENRPGTYLITLETVSGCDSILTYVVTLSGEPENASCETVLNFDGINDYVQLSNPLTIGGGSNTFELWVKVPTIGTGGLTSGERVGNILGNYNNTPNTNWELHSAGQVRIFWNNGEINSFGSTDLRDDKWHHLAFVRNTNDDNYKVYIDGELDLEHPSAGSNITFATAPRIGGDNRSGGGPRFHGSMDEMRVWNYAMTQEQVIWAASGQVDTEETGLVNYYDFNEGTGSIELNDQTAAENHGTLVSMDPSSDWTTNDGIVLPIVDLIGIDGTNPACFEGNDGEIEITATGGSGALSYSIDNGDSFESIALFEDLTADTYEIIVMDENGCEDNGAIELTDPSAIDIIEVNISDPACMGENGQLEIVATGGTPDLQYSIDNGDTFNPTNTFVTAAGEYDIVVEDDNGCQEVTTATLTDPAPVDNSVTQVGNELTAGSATGTFQWLDCDDESPLGETSSVYTAPNSGMYSVEVTEGTCIDTSDCFTVIITDLEPLGLGSNLRVFPNPTAGATNIDLGQSFNSGIVTISDITGQTIEQVELNGENIISVTIEKPAGVYFVNIKSGDLQKTIRVIKE